MRVLVCGGRDFAETDLLHRTLDEFHVKHCFTTLIEGGARGADTLAGEWADARGIERVTFMADWAGLGRKAGPIRNARMLSEGKPDMMIAFPGGRGTAHMVRIAREAGVEVVENPIPRVPCRDVQKVRIHRPVRFSQPSRSRRALG